AQFDGRGPAGDGADRHPKGCDASRCASGDIVHLHARSRSADPERGAAAKQRLVVVYNKAGRVIGQVTVENHDGTVRSRGSLSVVEMRLDSITIEIIGVDMRQRGHDLVVPRVDGGF